MRDLSQELDEKQLKWILSQLQEIYLNNYGESEIEEVEDIVKYAGLNNLHWDELGFFIKLVEMNPNYETEPIRVPKLKTVDVYISVDLTEYVFEKWRHTVQTYLDKDETDLIQEQMSETSYWEGDLIDKENYSTDINEEKIEDIRVRKK
jgi:hypothetical protein